jgi:MSHA biogenesis protein MshN
VGLLVDGQHADEASKSLKNGLVLSPMQSSISMTLARLQLESGDIKSARDNLEAGLPYAGEEASCQAFYAAFLQRDVEHDSAIKHYLIALRAAPSTPNWLVGIGISLQTLGRLNDATTAYPRARDTAQPAPPLGQFVESRLREISQR